MQKKTSSRCWTKGRPRLDRTDHCLPSKTAIGSTLAFQFSEYYGSDKLGLHIGLEATVRVNSGFFNELRRRGVFKIAALYIIGASVGILLVYV